jgi:beta-lactamase regulating signal transducer with metallopeptidase domain
MKNDVNASYSRVVNNVEPAILTSWNSNKVIQDSLKGQKLGDTMAKQTIMLWVIGVIGLVTMLITLNMSGLLGGASSAI